MKKFKISLPVKKKNKQIQKQTSKEAPPCIRMEASYMVEAAVTLPFYAGFMVMLLFFFQVLAVQQTVGNALLATGRELSVLCCEEELGQAAGLVSAGALFQKNLNGHLAAETYVRGGRKGISLLESEFSGDYIVLQADYRMRLPIGLFGRQEIPVTQKMKVRKWTGNAFIGTDEDEIVYITPTGSVYHRNRNCSYLYPSIEGVAGNRIFGLRNEDGGKYYACTKCIKNKNVQNTVVYITRYGNRYHGQADCSRLKRTVFAVRISEAENRHACSKCGRE